jgi:protein TonB
MSGPEPFTPRLANLSPTPPAGRNGAGVLTSSDRFGVSLFGSFLLHMVVILGVTFSLPKFRELEPLPTLEITLVQTRSDRAPQDAQFLAQANQDGGGEARTPEVARSPLPVREFAEPEPRLPRLEAPPQTPVASAREFTDLMTQRNTRKLSPPEPKPEKRDARTTPPRLGFLTPPSSEEERARLSAEISRSWQALQQRPRKKFINARTREYKYAAYMDAWRAKVERIGNLNYPEEARRRGLAGSLVLDVALNPDGTVHSVAVLRSSGHKLLDDAAVRIVELAAPFAPFPPEIRAETDILHITRTWKFNETLSSDTP